MNILTSEMYDILLENAYEYGFVNCWIKLTDKAFLEGSSYSGKKAIIKEYVVDKCSGYYSEEEEEILMANNFILPELAKQFEVASAKYFNVVFDDCSKLKNDDNYITIGKRKKQIIIPNQRYLLSPSFLEQDEEMIHLSDIFDNSTEDNVNKMIMGIEKFLKLRGFLESDIKKVKEDFIRQCIFNKFIGYSDEHNMNAVIIISVKNKIKRVRFGQSYDFDFSSGVYNLIDGQLNPRAYFRRSDDGKSTLISMLKQFKGEFEKEYLTKIIKNINIEQAIEIAEERFGYRLLLDSREQFISFYDEKLKELKEFYSKNYEEQKEKD